MPPHLKWSPPSCFAGATVCFKSIRKNAIEDPKLVPVKLNVSPEDYTFNYTFSLTCRSDCHIFSLNDHVTLVTHDLSPLSTATGEASRAWVVCRDWICHGGHAPDHGAGVDGELRVRRLRLSPWGIYRWCRSEKSFFDFLKFFF